MKKYILALTLIINAPITFAEQIIFSNQSSSPTLRACLYHHRIYAIVLWKDTCDTSLVDNGFFRSTNNHTSNNESYLNRNRSSKNSFSIYVEIPHDPDCFSTEPYY